MQVVIDRWANVNDKYKKGNKNNLCETNRFVFRGYNSAVSYLMENKYKLDRPLSKAIARDRGSKSFIYKHKRLRKYIQLVSSYTYVSKDSMDKGTVWEVKPL